MLLFTKRLQIMLLLIALTAPMLESAECQDSFPRSCTQVSGFIETQLVNEPIADFQVKLLQQAFETASLIPKYPHLKSRSKAQAAVVTTCLELDQAFHAKKFSDQIDINNWRKGLAYAQLADYCARHQYIDASRYCLDQVNDVVLNIEERMEPDEINWRRDRLNAMIAKTRNELETYTLSRIQSENTDDSEACNIATSDKSFEEKIKNLDEMINVAGFEGAKNALYAYAELFGHNYKNFQRRSISEKKIKASWDKTPAFIRINLLLEMSKYALDHSDSQTALRLVNEAQTFLDEHQWEMEEYIPMSAKIAQKRFQAGDMENARKLADKVNNLYDTRGNEIMGIYRSDALLPLAHAYSLMGDPKTALCVYKKAIKAGANNPNARPRAEDLSAACSSMALSATKPDKELWTQIQKIHKGLCDPW